MKMMRAKLEGKVGSQNKMNETINIYPTEAERNEYLAYKSEREFYDNLQTGIDNLKQWQFQEDKREVTLIAGAMVVFDKGTINFLNKLVRNDSFNRYILLSEVTAEFRRKTDMLIEFEHICTPHLLAKEIVVPYLNVEVIEDVKNYVEKKDYLKNAVLNLEARYGHMGKGYATALMYYADKYLRLLLQKINPHMVIMWNEFYPFHAVLKNICDEFGISIQYMEFGCIPGTIALEQGGQQGESFPARHPWKFNHLSISKRELINAQQVITYIRKEQLNRNIQPPWGKNKNALMLRRSSGPVITYMGQNDFESGMYPYTQESQIYHSPIFKSTLKGLEFLSVLAIRNEWNLIYKPHPIIADWNDENIKLENLACQCISDVNLHEIIDYSDVVVTILSQTAYEALFRGKPVVLMGYMQLYHSGCVYEALKKNLIEKRIKQAIRFGLSESQKKSFERHIARVLKYYVYDDLTHPEFAFGKKIE